MNADELADLVRQEAAGSAVEPVLADRVSLTVEGNYDD